MTNCYICNSEDVYRYKQVNGYSIYKCNLCSLFWVSDSIDVNKLDSFYNHDYYRKHYKMRMGYTNYLGGEENHRRNAKNLIKIIEKIGDINKMRVLDVGCACGFYLDELRKSRECEIYGVEHSEWARKYAVQNLQLHLFDHEKLDSSYFEYDYFDIVFLIGTIEHLVNPREMLVEIHRILKPSGLLVITTLDTKGIIQLFHLKPPEHLFYFNHNNLPLLLNQMGYKSIVNRPYFCSYFVYEVFNILVGFPALAFLKPIARCFFRFFPRISFKFLTNEMLVIARKLPG